MTTSTSTNLWVSPNYLKGRGDVKLFCFPYAGGGTAIFREWPKLLPPSVDACPVNLPGRGIRIMQPPFTNMVQLVEAATAGLLSYLDRPFAFFGHSMGAILAFEVARNLRKSGYPQPFHLFVSGRQAPHLPGRGYNTYDLPDAEFIDELRQLNGAQEEILNNPELLELVLPVLRADMQAIQTYAHLPEPPFNYPVTAYGGMKDRYVDREEVEAWKEYTQAAFSYRIFPGDHFFIDQYPLLVLDSMSLTLSKAVRLIK